MNSLFKNQRPGRAVPEGLLTELVESICGNHTGLIGRMQMKPTRHLAPSRDQVIQLVENLRSVLFPGYFGPTDLTAETVRYHVGMTLETIRQSLENQIKRGLCFSCRDDFGFCPEGECDHSAREITQAFLLRIPHIRQLLATDVQAAYEGDPAATSVDETIFCYPGVFAITNQRIAHELHVLGVKIIPRMMTEYAHTLTGIDIHPGARIGESFFIDHGTGVVIGETCRIGKKVRIYQGVTLGAKSFPLDENGRPIKGIDRHPIVEDDVIIYAGATILGRITIGRGATIGGNVWLTQSVPPGSRIHHRQPDLIGLTVESGSPVSGIQSE